MKISIIAAIGKNRELGKGGKIPWHISEDFKRFKEITSGHPVIMGRKTWESLPFKPLPNRTNMVVTRDSSLSFARGRLAKLGGEKRVVVCSSLEQALEKAKEIEKSEIFIIGGGQIYAQALSLADKLYLTIVEGNFDADTFFPDYAEFKKVVFEEKGEPALTLASRRSGRRGRSEGYKYKFLELER